MKQVATMAIALGLVGSVHAAECRVIQETLQKERHLTKPQLSPSGNRMFYQDGQHISVDLSCDEVEGAPNAMVNWDGKKPDKEFFDLANRVGAAVTGRSTAEVSKAVQQCLRDVAKSGYEDSSLEFATMTVECQAYVRDGGGTNVSFYLPR